MPPHPASGVSFCRVSTVPSRRQKVGKGNIISMSVQVYSEFQEASGNLGAASSNEVLCQSLVRPDCDSFHFFFPLIPKLMSLVSKPALPRFCLWLLPDELFPIGATPIVLALDLRGQLHHRRGSHRKAWFGLAVEKPRQIVTASIFFSITPLQVDITLH